MRKRTFQAEGLGSVKAQWQRTPWEPGRNHKEVSKHCGAQWARPVGESKVGGVCIGRRKVLDCFPSDRKPPGNFEQGSDRI